MAISMHRHSQPAEEHQQRLQCCSGRLQQLLQCSLFHVLSFTFTLHPSFFSFSLPFAILVHFSFLLPHPSFFSVFLLLAETPPPLVFLSPHLSVCHTLQGPSLFCAPHFPFSCSANDGILRCHNSSRLCVSYRSAIHPIRHDGHVVPPQYISL